MTMTKDERRITKQQVEDEVTQIAALGLEELRRFFTGKDRSPASMRAASIAGSVLSSFAKLRQSERAEQAMTLMIARDLAEDKTALRQYIAVALPQSPLVQAAAVLTEGKKIGKS